MTKACPNCGTEFDPLAGKYAPDGTIVCGPCGDRYTVAAKAQEAKSAGSAFVGSVGALLISLMSFIIQHRMLFFLFPVIGIVGGVGTAGVALRNQQAIAALGWKRFPTVVIGTLAFLLASFSLFLSCQPE